MIRSGFAFSRIGASLRGMCLNPDRTLYQICGFPAKPRGEANRTGDRMISTQLIEILQTSPPQNKENKRPSTYPCLTTVWISGRKLGRNASERTNRDA
jgi:hypothetical protein